MRRRRRRTTTTTRRKRSKRKKKEKRRKKEKRGAIARGWSTSDNIWAGGQGKALYLCVVTTVTSSGATASTVRQVLVMDGARREVAKDGRITRLNPASSKSNSCNLVG